MSKSVSQERVDMARYKILFEGLKADLEAEKHGNAKARNSKKVRK